MVHGRNMIGNGMGDREKCCLRPLKAPSSFQVIIQKGSHSQTNTDTN